MNRVRALIGLVLTLGLGFAVMFIWEKGHEMEKDDNMEASRAYGYVALLVFCVGSYIIYRFLGIEI